MHEQKLIRAKFASSDEFMGGWCETCLGGLMFVSDASSFLGLVLVQSINLRKSIHSALKALRVIVKIERGAG